MASDTLPKKCSYGLNALILTQALACVKRHGMERSQYAEPETHFVDMSMPSAASNIVVSTAADAVDAFCRWVEIDPAAAESCLDNNEMV